jgi:hypothetical protein
VALRLGSLVLVLVLSAPAGAEDRWTEPYPGVRSLERTTTEPAMRVFAVTADLTRPEVSVRATRRADRGRTVSAFAARYGVAVAVNGDFFESDFATEGLAMGAREQWTGSSDGPRWSFVAAGDGRAEIPLPEVSATAEAWMSEIVGGYPLLVDEGAALAFPDCTTSFCRRNPRTAVGVSRDGRTLILAVVDGRSTRSAGMSLPETAALMVELGAWRALNLDGGGSSAMWIDAEGGIVNSPSDGSERRVANHLGLAVAPPPDAGVPDAPPALVPVDAAAPAPPPAPDAAVALDDPAIGGGCAAGAHGDRVLTAVVALLLGCGCRRPRRRQSVK